MKKFIANSIITILSCLILYFGVNIFFKTYFNLKFYKTPNVVGLTMKEIENIPKINKLNVVVAGEDFSKYPAGVVFRQSPASDRVVKEDRRMQVWISKGKNDFVVPDLRNKNLIDALAILQSNGVKVNKMSYAASSLPYNTVLATSPAFGESGEKTNGISLLLSDTNSMQNVEVPDTVGLTFEEANNLLVSKGFVIGNITEKTVPDLEPGIVVETTNIGKKVPAGTVIDITISN